MIWSFVADHNFRLRSFLTSFIHEAGRKRFAAKFGCMPVSKRQSVMQNTFTSIPNDVRTQLKKFPLFEYDCFRIILIHFVYIQLVFLWFFIFHLYFSFRRRHNMIYSWAFIGWDRFICPDVSPTWLCRYCGHFKVELDEPHSPPKAPRSWYGVVG